MAQLSCELSMALDLKEAATPILKAMRMMAGVRPSRSFTEFATSRTAPIKAPVQTPMIWTSGGPVKMV